MKTKFKQLAGWLQGRTEKMSVRNKKIWLLLFCIACIIISAFVFMHRPHIFLVHQRVPKHIGKTIQPSMNGSISEHLFQRIELLKNNDSLLKANPAMLDTIHLIEQYYYSHSKK